MNEKKLSKLESEQVDDDFEKMLQEFINNDSDADEDLDEDTTSDDPDADEDDGEHQSFESTDVAANDDDEDLPIRVGVERNYMPEITKVEIEIQPLIFGSLYVNGDVAVTIHGQAALV